MIFCARATRGLRRSSLGLMARFGKSIAKQSEGRAGEKYLPVGGRVRRLRAVEDQSAPIPEKTTSELGRSIDSCIRITRELRRKRAERPGALLARRTRTVNLCSPGARARLGALGVGRVRMWRAVKDSLSHPLDKR